MKINPIIVQVIIQIIVWQLELMEFDWLLQIHFPSVDEAKLYWVETIC